MATSNKTAVSKTLSQIQNLMLNKKFVDTVSMIRKDRKLQKTAKANPKAFFRQHGVSIPQTLSMKISVTIQVCVTICGTVGGVRICVTICGVIRF